MNKEATVKLAHNEVIKDANPTLAGTLAQTLANPEADRFTEDDFSRTTNPRGSRTRQLPHPYRRKAKP